MLKNRPATLILVGVNVLFFGISYLQAGTLEYPQWLITQFEIGALFNPLVLEKEWYRIVAHMFLHGHFLHLAVNMYALYASGGELEEILGWKKFLIVYFLSGVGGAILSLYWNLFVIGVGASGAIFGLFGFTLVINIIVSRRDGLSILPLLMNFAIFVLINILFGEAFHADHAAHAGGFLTGAAIAATTYYTSRHFREIKLDLAFVLVLAILFFALPRFQVHYYRFMQQVLRAEDSYNEMANDKDLSDDEIAMRFEQNNVAWDSAKALLQNIPSVPLELKKDSASLSAYVSLRKLENVYKIRMIRDERYILLDSVDAIQDSMASVLTLDHPQAIGLRRSRMHESIESIDTVEKKPEFIQVWYDSNWVEIPGPGHYYRIGYRDSLGQWQGAVRDYYASGKIQMKGTYKDGDRHGIFLYYSDHDTYTSAGRYVDNQSYGKWQNFHDNGKLQSETVYLERAFLRTMYDTAGNVLVENGRGRVVEYYPDGSMRTEGNYYDGAKEGTWIGRHRDGSIYYKEEYSRGVLVSGRSQLVTGERYIYTAESLFPKPEGGREKLQEYLRRRAATENLISPGVVKISFRVTAEGVLTDFEYEHRLNSSADEKAKQYLMEGPVWLPAKLHGHKPVDGFAWVDVEF